METLVALLTICAGNSPVPGEFPAQRPVTRSFNVYFDLRLNKRLSKQSWGWWFETLSRPLWRHSKVCKSPQPCSTHMAYYMVGHINITIAETLGMLDGLSIPARGPGMEFRNQICYDTPVFCVASTLKRKCRHFDEIFITSCTGSCHFDNFQCSQWWKFNQNEDIFVSVNINDTLS